MGPICGTQKRNRCERQETYQQPTERETVQMQRRYLVCVAQHGLCVHRHPDRRLTSHYESRNPQPSADLVVLRTVSFATDVTVFIPMDWSPHSPETYRLARRGPWIQIAVDRHRFMRRIQQTENDFTTIFTIEHRDRIIERFYD
jgi:Phosphatase-1 catalytic subunit binding region